MKLLNDCKYYYNIIFENNKINEDNLREALEGKNYIKERIEIIKFIYDLVLHTGTDYEYKYLKKWIKNSVTTEKIAEIFGVDTTVVNNEILEFSEKYCKRFVYDNKSLLSICLIQDHISEYDMEELLLDYKQAKTELESIIVNVDRQFNEKECTLNIPKYALVKTCDEARFNEFIQLIKPYVLSVKKSRQKELNSMIKEVGYFNYLMSDTSELKGIDIKRKEDILKLLETGEYTSEKTNIEQTSEKIENNTSKEEVEQQIAEEIAVIDYDSLSEKEKKSLTEIKKSTRVQFDF